MLHVPVKSTFNYISIYFLLSFFLKKLEKLGIEISNNALTFNTKKLEIFISEFYEFLQKFPARLATKNLTPTHQLGPNCYLVAGIEMLLSSTTFLRFIEFYLKLEISKEFNYAMIESNVAKSIDKTGPDFPAMKFCEVLKKYVKAKPEYGEIVKCYGEMDRLLKEQNFETGIQDDLNVVIIYFQRSFLFNCIFSFREAARNGCEFHVGPVYEGHQSGICGVPKIGIFVFTKNSGETIAEALARLNKHPVIAVAPKTGGPTSGHYEIYQRVKNSTGSRFIAKNTDGRGSIWTALYVVK